MIKKAIVLFVTFWFSIAISQSRSRDIFFTIDTVQMADMNIRSLVPEKDRVWFAANQGRFGYYDFLTNTAFEKRIVFDSLKPEFRSMAETKDNIFILSIANPALLYKIDKQTAKPKLVYSEKHEKAFYDSMKFWNDKEGIALGDPIGDCLSILITRDGGDNWTKLNCESLPKLAEGEAAFAASNTNIAIKGNRCWIVSGGTKARIFYSADKGKTWTVYDTPIVQGKPMTGIYTADFYNEKIGVIAGGDYENPDHNFANKAITTDGGKTWAHLASGSGFGYASCIQFVPDSEGRKLLSVGRTGMWYSSDGGYNWQKLLDDKTLYTIAFADGQTAYAAGKGKILRIKFKK